MTNSAKFFLVSFLVFALILIINLGVLGGKTFKKRGQEKIDSQVEAVTQSMAEAESALIYKNEEQAFRLLSEAKTEIDVLKGLDQEAGTEMERRFYLLSDRINRVTYVANPKAVAEFKFSPAYMTKAGNGYIFSGKTSNELISYANNTAESIFLLNSSDGDISGLIHVPSSGNWLTGFDKVYKINEPEDLLETSAEVSNGNLLGLEYLSPNRIYVANKNTNQITRFLISGNRLISSTNLLKTSTDLSDLKDFGVDTDVYLLFPNEIRKFSSGNEQMFDIAKLTDPIVGASRLFVGNNLFILEPSKKRLVIMSKTGKLINQIIFTNASQLSDFYVDETQRTINLLDGNKLIEITF